jgi:transglutaminase-like putative cysteine protease
MHLRITHETRYDYTPAVDTAQHLLHLQPRSTPRQNVARHRMQVWPEPRLQLNQSDLHGNPVQYVALHAPHARLTLLAESEVLTLGPGRPGAAVLSTSWESVMAGFRYQKGVRYDPAIEHVYVSDHVPRHPAFHEYALPSFGPGRPLHEAARDLSARIHRDFRYQSQSTDVSTPTLQALQQRCGVCQDFAHIFIACCRAMGLAARYVSGYLLTQPPPGQPRLIGSDASHAWASVYVPDGQGGDGYWLDCDPTNDRCDWETPGEDYVTLAIGRDYADVSPVRGVILGGAHHTLTVAVTVEPVASEAASPRF